MFRANIMYILAMFLLMSTFLSTRLILRWRPSLRGSSRRITLRSSWQAWILSPSAAAFCSCGPRGCWRKDRVPGALCFLIGYLLLALLADGPARCLAPSLWLCQRSRHPLHYVRGLHESRQGGGHYGDASDLRGSVSGAVCLSRADVRCDGHLWRNGLSSAYCFAIVLSILLCCGLRGSQAEKQSKDCFIDLRPFLCYDNTVIILVQKGVFSWKIRLKI